MVLSRFMQKLYLRIQNILVLDYGGDNLSHPYTHVFGNKKSDFGC